MEVDNLLRLKPFSQIWMSGCYTTTLKDFIVAIETEGKDRLIPC